MQHALKTINNFDIIYKKQIEIFKEHPDCYAARFVEQYCYIYDSRKIGLPCDALENLKLYFLNIERNEINQINNLSFYYAKGYNSKVYYFITYFEKNEMYVEICMGGIYVKTFLTSWLTPLRLKVKQKIDVEYIY